MGTVAIVGTVGLPASYGGFETLAENLVKYHEAVQLDDKLIVYCSSIQYVNKLPAYRSAELVYLPLKANGLQSIFYDIWSILSAVLIKKADVVLVLGVSGAVIIPFVAKFSKVKIVTNIDGVEWRRSKWSWFIKSYLKFSEALAVKHSHSVVTDNTGITEYVEGEYGVACETIAYGGDHVFYFMAKPDLGYILPEKYVFSVCRIEKENNIEMIVSAFVGLKDLAVVIVGNWESSVYGQGIRARFRTHGNIILLDPIYDLAVLRTMRENAHAIVHGHSAGGTNPALVEAMWFEKPIYAFDCIFNRYTTENFAKYFGDTESLRVLVSRLPSLDVSPGKLKVLAVEKYSWSIIAKKYFDLFNRC